jgi:hypothetical protein
VSRELVPPAAVVVPIEAIQQRIHVVRAEKVMLDEDLAELYGVETRALIQAVRATSADSPRTSCFACKRRNSRF